MIIKKTYDKQILAEAKAEIRSRHLNNVFYRDNSTKFTELLYVLKMYDEPEKMIENDIAWTSLKNWL